MRFIESLRMAFDALLANKMRALLTMLGIIIGISSVLTMVGLGNGGQAKMKKQFESYGMTRAAVYVNDENLPSEEYLISNNDIEMIQRAFKNELDGLTPRMDIGGTLALGKKMYHMNLNGVNGAYKNIEKMVLREGRFINKEDVLGDRAVCVIDKKMATKFYPGTSAVGSRIAIDIGEESTSYLVVGVYEKESSLGGATREEYDLYVPYTNIQLLTGQNDLYYFELKTKPDIEVADFLKKLINLIERRHDSIGKDYYMSYNSQKEMNMFSKVTNMMTLFVSAIAGISLLVGGIGIMNIMLVSVTERTKEIGTRKALGASKKEIMLQFLIESVVVSAVGGIIGVMSGFGLGHLVGKFIKLTPVIPFKIVAVSILFSATIGIFFGLYPAKKAADLNPIDALRYE